jgi:predicted MFS family arabinose efflux permease
VSSAYRWYVLGLLTAVYVINFVDRQILAVLIEPIKAELGLSDTDMGLLSGLAFAIFYVSFGIPIARLADRYSRRNIIAVAMAAWSIMTAVCGAAASFGQLLAARIGVAVGESGCVAPAHSILSDYFQPHRRPLALSIFSTGAAAGIFLGLLLGGWLSDLYGWRMTLVIIGLPGVLVSLLLIFTLREPLRGMSSVQFSSQASNNSKPGAFLDDLRLLLQRRTLVFIGIGAGSQSMVTYGTASWLPAFYMRVHDISASEAGGHLALISGLGAGIGTLVGGVVTTWLAKEDRRWLMWVPAITAALATPFYMLSAISTNTTASLLWLTPAAFLAAMFLGPALAATHGVSGVTHRATGIALVLFASNMLGIGGGALVVGVISDFFAAAEPQVSLRYGLIAVYAVNIVAIISYLLAARGLNRDWQD